MLPARPALVRALWRLHRSILPLEDRLDFEDEVLRSYVNLQAMDRIRRIARLGPRRAVGVH